MSLRLQFRRYRLPLRFVVRTAHDVWTERQGLLVRAEEAGAVAFAEIAPIPAFGTETVDEAEAALAALGEFPTEANWSAVPARLGCVRQALATVRAELARSACDPAPNNSVAKSPDAKRYRAVAALLPAGRAALEQVPARADVGFRVFKWKVGVGDSADELSLLDDLCAALPSGAKLRLDANGAWNRRQAERWLERCADRPIEFIEQPCFVSAADGETARRRCDDTLLGLAREYPTPIALDESVIGEGDVERWLDLGWPGWFVLKTSLLGDVTSALARLEKANATVVFSSALETAVGARVALRHAFDWRGEAKALGFGVWPLFADARFDGPAAAPFIRAEDVERIAPEKAWNALD